MTILMLSESRVTDGIELSDDPILAARHGIYEVSIEHQTGGCKGHQASLDHAGCPLCARCGR